MYFKDKREKLTEWCEITANELLFLLRIYHRPIRHWSDWRE